MQSPDEPTRSHFRYRILPAAIVVGIGVLFLLRNLGVDLDFFQRGNWWAWLVLIAAIAPLMRAWELYNARGRVDGAVTHSLVSAGVVALVACMFLLGLDWATWWPLFVIAGGLYTLTGRGYRRCYGRYGNDPSAKS